MTDGVVFDIQRYSIHDGPGVRTLVFLKGCPLACVWCSNPESQHKGTDILYDVERCAQCLSCVQVCPTGALISSDGAIKHNPALCTGCGLCVSMCPNNARRLSGSRMTVEDVMAVVARDAPFYRRSGGGATLGGGEPTAQPEFATAILMAAYSQGIDTAIETSGYAPTETVLSVAQRADHVLFDVKHANADRHKELTGVSNELIVDNLRALLHTHPDVTVRYPLVPGCNADDEDLRALAGMLLRLPRPPHLEFVPYHRFGEHKYRLLGRDYALSGVAACDASEAEDACSLVRQFGLECSALAH